MINNRTARSFRCTVLPVGSRLRLRSYTPPAVTSRRSRGVRNSAVPLYLSIMVKLAIAVIIVIFYATITQCKVFFPMTVIPQENSNVIVPCHSEEKLKAVLNDLRSRIKEVSTTGFSRVPADPTVGPAGNALHYVDQETGGHFSF